MPTGIKSLKHILCSLCVITMRLFPFFIYFWRKKGHVFGAEIQTWRVRAAGRSGYQITKRHFNFFTCVASEFLLKFYIYFWDKNGRVFGNSILNVAGVRRQVRARRNTGPGSQLSGAAILWERTLCVRKTLPYPRISAPSAGVQHDGEGG